jgi:hypothetical protein
MMSRMIQIGRLPSDPTSDRQVAWVEQDFHVPQTDKNSTVLAEQDSPDMHRGVLTNSQLMEWFDAKGIQSGDPEQLKRAFAERKDKLSQLKSDRNNINKGGPSLLERRALKKSN